MTSQNHGGVPSSVRTSRTGRTDKSRFGDSDWSSLAIRSSGKPKHEQMTFKNIPQELLNKIAGYLAVKDLLSLRLTNHSCRGPAEDHLRERLTTLYLHPTKDAMARSLAICNSDLYADYITEEAIDERHRDYQRRAITAACPSVLEDPEWHHIFRSWPRDHPTLPLPSDDAGHVASQQRSDQSKGKYAIKIHSPESHRLETNFNVCYESLIGALSRLKNLDTLSIWLPRVRLTGLNKVSQQQMHDHCRSITQPIVSLKDLTREPVKHMRRSDADVFYRLLIALGQKIKAVSLLVELPLYEEIARDILPRKPGPGTQAFDHLASLDLSSDAKYPHQPSYSLYNRLIRYSSLSLECLKIRRILPDFEQFQSKSYLLEIVLWGYDRPWVILPKLRRLEIISVIPHTFQDSRTHRSSYLDFKITEFLEPHLATLTDIIFDNVVFFSDANDLNIKDVTEQTLQLLRSGGQKLEHISWRINLFLHFDNCERPRSEEPLSEECLLEGCGNYEDERPNPITYKDMTNLAAAHGVKLDTKRHTWDFGDYLQPSIAARMAERELLV